METHDSEHEEQGIEELDHVPQPHGRLTGATIATVRDRLIEDGLLFHLDDEGIARHFTAPFFSGNAWKVDLSVLRNVVADLDGCPDDIPRDPGAFATWVRTELLDFEHLPRDALAKLYKHASEDLAQIQANIRYCRAQLEKIEKRNPKTDADNSDRGFYQYFLMRNYTARDEIVDVLANSIQREALRSASNLMLGGIYLLFDRHIPWDFRWLPDRYAAEKYSPVAHAFRALTRRKFQAIQQLYQEGRWNEFDQAMGTYIRERSLVERIRQLLHEHHLLAARRDVLLPALHAYERGELALFCSAVAVQIEGVFEDACQLSGVSLDTLRVATLVPKLNALVRTGDVEIDYAYYAFKFPPVRNRVAHGRMLAEDLARTADMLLLDLHYVCNVVRTHPGPGNALVELLKDAAAPLLTVGQVTEFCVLLAESDRQPPDRFYGLAREFATTMAALEHPRVQEFLEQLVELDHDDVASGIRFLATRLKNKLREARPLLRKLGTRGSTPFDRTEFFRIMRAVPGQDALMHTGAELRAMFLGLLNARAEQMQALTILR